MALQLSGDALGLGKVLQVVQGTTTTQTDVTSTSLTDSSLSATITPHSVGSKVLVLVNQSAAISRNNVSNGAAIAIVRDSTVIYGNNHPWEEQLAVAGTTSVSLRSRYSRIYLDSPNSTVAVTYKTQGRLETTADSSLLRFQQGGIESVMILIEVAA